MIRTWMADVSALLEGERYLYYYNCVPKFRQEKADKLRMPKDKALSIGAWILFQTMQKEYGLKENASFNLSHSGEYALCAVEDSGLQVQVGCDIEEMNGLKMSVAQRFFCESEYQYIRERVSKKEQEEAFYRYWVLKESFMKATKLGMKLKMNQFELEIGDDILLKKTPDDLQGEYYFKEYSVEHVPYRIAVCSDSNHFAKEIQRITL